jgi:hypothetical protein
VGSEDLARACAVGGDRARGVPLRGVPQVTRELFKVPALTVDLAVDLVGVEASRDRVELQHRLVQVTQMRVQRRWPDAPPRPAHSGVIAQANVQLGGHRPDLTVDPQQAAQLLDQPLAAHRAEHPGDLVGHGV